MIFLALRQQMRQMRTLTAALTTVILFGQAQPTDLPAPDPAVIDFEAATKAYLDTIPADKCARWNSSWGRLQ